MKHADAAPHNFSARRERVRAQLGADGVLVLPAAPELLVGRDTELRYHVDAELYYVTGYHEPDAVAVLNGGDAGFVLFVRERDPERELWTGRRGGVEQAREGYGATAAYPIAQLPEKLPQLLADARVIYARSGVRADVDAVVGAARAAALQRKARRGTGALTLADPALILDELRLRKDAAELEHIRAAARVTAAAFAAAARVARTGRGEWELEATIEYEFRRRGADGPAFPTIVASADNATILHYIHNDRSFQRGDLVLVDAGARWRRYCADVSRTFPVDGSFSPAQRALYDAVLRARDAAIAAVRPGAALDAVHRAARRELLACMVEQRLVTGVTEELLEAEDAGKAFFPHKTSHWLGLDVHDAGDYVVDGAPRVLEPGMVFTIEPGLYVPAHPDTPAELHGIGIRIEDDVLVTADGCEVLTDELPAHADEVAALVCA